MSRYLLAVLCLVLLASCGGNKTGHSEEADVPADSGIVVADSTEQLQENMDDQLADQPMPKAADELFDDFIFNFAVNRKLQMERIMFPLKKVNGDKVETVQKSQWKIERYFMRQNYYTLLFDNERHMEVVKDTSLNHAIVEMIYFNTGAVVQHKFDRLHGAWMLTSIETIPISSSCNASFLEFYERSAFAPELPKTMLFNIIYGQPHKETNTKVFVLRGIANGMELEMTFVRKGGTWKLTKLTT